MDLGRLVKFLTVGARNSKLAIPIRAPRIELSVLVHAHGVVDSAFYLDDV